MLLTRDKVSIGSEFNFNLKSFVRMFSDVSHIIMESMDEGRRERGRERGREREKKEGESRMKCLLPFKGIVI